MSVGRIIRKARLACDLTQGQIATAAGMAQSIVSAIERGARNPTIRTLKRLAKALGLRLVVRLENENGSGFEWSTSLAEAKNLTGYAGTQPSAHDRTPLIEPTSLGSG
jgi:transcriptional regulator with XRE-family HTH domain